MLKNILQKAFAKTTLKGKPIQQKELADMCGVSESQISKILSGSVIPNEQTIRKIAQICNIDEELAVTARWLESAPKEINTKIDKLIEFQIEFGKKTFFNNKNLISDEQFDEVKKEMLKTNRAEIFLQFLSISYSQINKAANNIKITDNFEKINVNIDTNSMIKIEDDNMSPIIPINSYIKSEIRDKYNNNDIVYFSYKGKNMCRGLINMNNNALFLYSLKGNSNFIININDKDDKDFVIIGKVTQVAIDI